MESVLGFIVKYIAKPFNRGFGVLGFWGFGAGFRWDYHRQKCGQCKAGSGPRSLPSLPPASAPGNRGGSGRGRRRR